MYSLSGANDLQTISFKIAKKIKKYDHLLFNNVQPKSLSLKALLRSNFNKFLLRKVSLISKAAANIKLIIVGFK